MIPLRITRASGFGTKPPQDFDLSPITFGTTSSSSVKFDPAFDRGVAAQHAKIEWSGAKWWLLDLGSPAGTWVDGRRLAQPLEITGPVSFSLGQTGPKILVEPQAAAAFAQAPPAASIQAPAKPAARPNMVPLVVAAVLIVAVVLGGGAFFLLRQLNAKKEGYAVRDAEGEAQLAPLEEAETPPLPKPKKNKEQAQSVLSRTGFGMGLKEPSPEEQKYIDNNVPVVREVRFNSLAIARGVKPRGGGTFSMGSAVPVGQELVTSLPGKNPSTMSVQQKVGEAELPLAVDNSKLECFPPIGDQKQLGSCACFAMVYYTASHNLAHVRGWSAKDPARDLSPKWAYAIANGGDDSGSSLFSLMHLLQRHGAPTLADWPYSGDPKDPLNYREWPVDERVWRSAIDARFPIMGILQSLDKPAGLAALKDFLANGFICAFATNVEGWAYKKSQVNPDKPDAKNDGADVCYYVRDIPSGHAMTVVGYDDTMWVDVNGNGKADAGETGALKIANSWGTNGWPEISPGTVNDPEPKPGPKVGVGGFVWILYDALKPKSEIPGFAPEDRWSPGAFRNQQANYVWPSEKASKPVALARIKLSTDQRGNLDLRFGISAAGEKKPEIIWRPGVLAMPIFAGTKADVMELYEGTGGAFGMRGSEGESEGTCLFDMDDLLIQTINSYLKQGVKKVTFYLVLTRLSPDAKVTLESFEIVNGDGALMSKAKDLPAAVKEGGHTFSTDVQIAE